MARVNLTTPILEAISNAVNAILAGDMDGRGDEGDIAPKTYERASQWIAQELRKREQS